MWPFRKAQKRHSVAPNAVHFEADVAVIDVRGQTCPGYLLAINKAVAQLAPGTRAKLLVTYPPSGEDVKSWCNEKHIQYLGLSQRDGVWEILIRK